MQLIDLRGRHFGRLIVLRRTLGLQTKPVWLCRCICGRKATVIGNNLLRGHTISCGCVQREVTARRSRGRDFCFKHGHAKHTGHSREYISWCNMIQRCTNPNATAYKWYGGDGVKVCKRWRGEGGFNNFLADMGPRPIGTSIHRRGDKGDYKPGNCVWATPKEHAVDRRRE